MLSEKTAYEELKRQYHHVLAKLMNCGKQQ